ncbi:MAG TPA: hypothetical protein VFU31_11340 [Candidatus Binatia bacterium]|nr:hypothetical protein [Candidatus Binatia bacterium]
MPRLTDRTKIRTMLETDRPWAVYALADLEPGLFEPTTWFGFERIPMAIALIYSRFATPVL